MWAAVGSIKQRPLAPSSCLECSQSYGDCVCEETSFQIAVAWLRKCSKSSGEVLQWAEKYIYQWRGKSKALMTAHLVIFPNHEGNGLKKLETTRRVKQRLAAPAWKWISLPLCKRRGLCACAHNVICLYNSAETLNGSCWWIEALRRSSRLTSELNPPRSARPATSLRCESARESYLKDYLMAASSSSELKGQLPETAAPQMPTKPLKCYEVRINNSWHHRSLQSRAARSQHTRLLYFNTNAINLDGKTSWNLL